jgi:hypothetical protein
VQGSTERDLDAALAALIEGALRRAADEGRSTPAEQARVLAQAVAVGLRELVRAPLREALQAGYDLGWRAAQEAQREAAGASPADAALSAPSSGAAPEEPGAREMSAALPLDRVEADAAERPRQVCVEVGPLPSFSAVNRFHAAVAGIPDVADTTMVAFRDGRLTLRVEHADGRVLVAALQALDLGPFRVVAAAADRVELALDDRPPPAIAARPGWAASYQPSARGGRPSHGR